MRSDANAIEIRNVTKTFRMGVGRARIREMLPFPFDRALARMFPRWWMKDTFNALEDVSFTVPRGGTVALVGHNGAGKSTLLKVIASVTEPTTGQVAVRGRVAALINLFVGFHPDLTGRENLYLLGALQGQSRQQMDRKVGEIFEFAEISDLADTPLKRYSSGMTARLGFAAFTVFPADIMLVDEVLTVGDASFQRKCIDWLDGFRQRGGTMLFVSHNLALVRSMTERAVWIDHGRVMQDGPTGEVLGQYAKAMEQRHEGAAAGRGRSKGYRRRGLLRWGAGGARIKEASFSDPVPGPDGSRVEVSIAYESQELGEALFAVGFVDEEGRSLGSLVSEAIPLNGGSGSVACRIEPLPLREGIYFPVVAILSTDGQIRDQWRMERAIVVEADGYPETIDAFGPIAMGGTWGTG